MSVGKLAWQTLLSGNPMLRKGDVKRELGPEVFNWGLLIGNENADKLTDVAFNILVTFAHQSIEEFFGSVYFILRLSEGETIESLLGGDCEKPIFMVNPLFLEFCLWLLKDSDLTSFVPEKENRQWVHKALAAYITKKIDDKYLSLEDVGSKFPALNIGLDFPKFNAFEATNVDHMSVDLLKAILSQCSKTEWLILLSYHPVDELLSALNPCLSSKIKILVLEVSGAMLYCRFDGSKHQLKSTTPQNPCSTGLHVKIYDAFSEAQRSLVDMLKAAMRYCTRAERLANVYLTLGKDSQLELSTVLQYDVHGLHLDCSSRQNTGLVQCHQDIPRSLIRHLSVTYLENADNVLKALSKAF